MDKKRCKCGTNCKTARGDRLPTLPMTYSEAKIKYPIKCPDCNFVKGDGQSRDRGCKIDGLTQTWHKVMDRDITIICVAGTATTVKRGQ